MTEENQSAVEITERELDEVSGGVLIGLLLPAVQKVRSGPSPIGGFTDGEAGTGPRVAVFDGRTGG